MKKLFYILNTKTDKSFDTMENKFYGSNWQPAYEDDREWLQGMIDEDPEKFENCIVEEVEIED